MKIIPYIGGVVASGSERAELRSSEAVARRSPKPEVATVPNYYNTREILYNKYIDNWYLIVFAPLNKTYDDKFVAFDHIRKKCCTSLDSYIITKEVNATKIHWNLLINSSRDLLKFHGEHTNKFFIHVQHIKSGTHWDVYDYITKEFNMDSKIYNEYIFNNVIISLPLLYVLSEEEEF